MDDPMPENIDGTKVERHTFEHRMPWGQIAIGVGLIALAYAIHKALDRDLDLDEDDSDGGVME
jgi:hypothetical protein